MGDRGATGGAWGARDEASWWPGGAGELQHQQQLNEDIIARSTAGNTHQLYTYKMTGGFSNNGGGDNTAASYDYRLMPNSNNREQSPQQSWWYASGSVESQQGSSPTVRSVSFSNKYELCFCYYTNQIYLSCLCNITIFDMYMVRTYQNCTVSRYIYKNKKIFSRIIQTRMNII